MAKVRQSGFAGGEIAPELYARTDLDRYGHSARALLNFYASPLGAAMNRTGGKHLLAVKGNAGEVRLIPFIWSSGVTYVIEMGIGYFRFWKNGVRVAHPTPPAAYNAGTTYAKGDFVLSGGFQFRSLVAGNIGNTPDFTSSYWLEETRPYEVANPYTTAAEVWKVRWVQSGDTLTLNCKGYQTRQLVRTADASWAISTFGPSRSVQPPTGIQVFPTTNPAADPTHPSKVWRWTVTSVYDGDTPEESLPATGVQVQCQVYTDRPASLTWTAPASGPTPTRYYVYRGRNGKYGFIGEASGTSFNDDGLAPALNECPPTARDPFTGTDREPQLSTYHETRQLFGNSAKFPGGIWSSQTSNFKNFDYAEPAKDSDAWIANFVGRQWEEIRNLVSLRSLLVLTSGGEYSLAGLQGDPITPKSMDPKQHSRYGCAWLDALVVGNSVLWVTDPACRVRDLVYDANGETYTGNDLTMLAQHLFRGHTIKAWCYVPEPHNLILAVRDDGILLALTYVREHQVWAWGRWARGDGRAFLDVCSVPEGTSSAVYLLVGGGPMGCTMERLANRPTSSSREGLFYDSHMTFDGRNQGATPMYLWPVVEGHFEVGASVEVYTNVGVFEADDVGDSIFLDPGGYGYRIELTTFTGSDRMTGIVREVAIPDFLQKVNTTNWGWGRVQFDSLHHMAGETIHVFSEDQGMPHVQTGVVPANGFIELPFPVCLASFGVPYNQDLELLDLHVSGTEVRGRNFMVRKVQFEVDASRGAVMAGETFENLEASHVEPLTSGQASGLVNGFVEVLIPATSWNKAGRACLRQVYPYPLTVLGAIREVEVAGG